MLRSFAAMGLALVAGFGAMPAAAQETDWGLSYIDADGNVADARTGYQAIAFVRGPRDFVLELTCVEGEERMIFRLAKRKAGRERFTGETFSPTFVVRDSGKVVFELTAERDFQYREGPMFYRGPVRDRLMRELARGDALVVRESGSTLQVRFTLRGSAAAIAALPCSDGN